MRGRLDLEYIPAWVSFSGCRFIAYFYFTFWIMDVIRCFFCVISFLYWVEVIYLFNVFVFWGGRLDLEYIPTCTDFFGACSSLICPYQNTNREKDYYNALSFSSFFVCILPGYFLWFVDALFFPAISLDNDFFWLPVFNYKCLKCIRYNWVSSVSMNKLISIASSFIVLYQNINSIFSLMKYSSILPMIIKLR